MSIKLNDKFIKNFIKEEDYKAIGAEVSAAYRMVAVGVVKVILEELFRSLRHGHYLALKALSQLHGASAAVDNGTDAYDRIAAYVTILCHIFFLLENCTLRHCRGHEFGSRGRIYLITHNAINMYFLYYQLGLEHGHAGRDCASVQPFY